MTRNVWHDKTQNPKAGKWVLYNTIENAWKVTRNWHNALKNDWIISWAYVDDIIDCSRGLSQTEKDFEWSKEQKDAYADAMLGANSR